MTNASRKRKRGNPKPKPPVAGAVETDRQHVYNLTNILQQLRAITKDLRKQNAVLLRKNAALNKKVVTSKQQATASQNQANALQTEVAQLTHLLDGALPDVFHVGSGTGGHTNRAETLSNEYLRWKLNKLLVDLARTQGTVVHQTPPSSTSSTSSTSAPSSTSSTSALTTPNGVVLAKHQKEASGVVISLCSSDDEDDGRVLEIG